MKGKFLIDSKMKSGFGDVTGGQCNHDDPDSQTELLKMRTDKVRVGISGDMKSRSNLQVSQQKLYMLANFLLPPISIE